MLSELNIIFLTLNFSSISRENLLFVLNLASSIIIFLKLKFNNFSIFEFKFD